MLHKLPLLLYVVCLFINIVTLAFSPGYVLKARKKFEVNEVLLLICILHIMSFNTSGGAF